MKLYINTAEACRSHKPRLKNFLEIFSQKYEVRILIFFKTFKDGIWYNTISTFNLGLKAIEPNKKNY